MKMNAESLSMKMARAFATCTFHTFSVVPWNRLRASDPKDYHVFSFTAIRALFVIMQMRKHAGYLIRAQIWFHMKDCRGVGAWSHNVEQQNYAQYLFSRRASTRTRRSFIGLRFALVQRLEVNSAAEGLIIFCSPQRCWIGTAVNGEAFPYQRQSTAACVFAFLLLPRPLNQISKCSAFFCSPAERRENGLLIIARKLRGCLCAVVCAAADNWWLNWMLL